MSDEVKKKIAELLKKNILVSPDYLEQLKESPSVHDDVVVLSRETSTLADLNYKEVEKVRVLHEKGKAALPSLHDLKQSQQPLIQPVRVTASHKINAQKSTVQHFVEYFNTRYNLLANILRSRPELQNLTAIRRLKDRSDARQLSVIGMILEKTETKNKNIMLTVEDPTGSIRILINRNRGDLFSIARDLTEDEVIGIMGSYREGIMFANTIIHPDIPNIDLKKSPVEEYAAFMSDLHFGSKQFMKDEFQRFLNWVNGDVGTSAQKEVASKLKYILIAGDIVDGVGIYQTQFDELTHPDIREQYKECARYLKQIPDHIRVIISPGNHDAVRMAEPQPPLINEYTSDLQSLPNLTFISNPGTVRIGQTENFSGFDCLLYHGYSFDHYAANIDSIRQNGGYHRGDLIMKYLLQRRHLAPTHASTLIHPTPKQDALFINPVPDFFVTGHIHYVSVSNYKSTSLINSSCWQSLTSFQERMGHDPQPARLPIVNLKTRDSKIINFSQ